MKSLQSNPVGLGLAVSLNIALCKPTFCRLKLDAAGEPLSTVRVAIYVVYLRSMQSAMQHKESNPNTYLPG